VLGVDFGDPHYKTPEQAQGRPVDRRGDIYSLGTIAFHMLAGHPPFDGTGTFDVLRKHLDSPVPSARRDRPDCPDWLDELVQRMMAKKPDDRLLSVTQLVESLQQKRAPETSTERERQAHATLTQATLKIAAITPPPEVPTDDRPASKSGQMHAVELSAPPPVDIPSVVIESEPDEKMQPTPTAPAKRAAATSERSHKDISGEWFTQPADLLPYEEGEQKKTGWKLIVLVGGALTAAVGLFVLLLPKPPPAREIAQAPPRAEAPAPTANAQPPTPAPTPAPTEPPAVETAKPSAPAATITQAKPEPPKPEEPKVETPEERRQRERAEKAAKLEQERADKAARLEQERAAITAKLEQERVAKAAKVEQERAAIAAKLEQERVARAAKVEQERADKAVKAERDKAERDKARAEKAAKVEQERADKAAKAERDKAVKAKAVAVAPKEAPPNDAKLAKETKAKPEKSESAGQADFFIKVGKQRLSSNDLTGATTNFNKAREYDSRNPEALAGLGEVAFEQGDYGGAANHLKQAIKISPNKPRYLVLLGQAYYKLGKAKEAAGEYRKALRIDPSNQEAQHSLQVAERKLQGG
jgi:tetratricopeptide (TPR) repeat protein